MEVNLTQSLYLQFLTIQKYNLQYRLMQNNMAMMSAIRNPMSYSQAYALDKVLSLDNANIQTQLLMIEAQEEAAKKKLNLIG